MARKRGHTSLGTIGELGSNLQALRGMKKRLAEEGDLVVEAERWGTLSLIVERLVEACENKDLEGVAAATRDMKNRLRRPAIRRALAEAEEKKAPEGQCKCEACSAIIDGSREPCVKGALCTKCALKHKTTTADDKAEKAARKGAAGVKLSPTRKQPPAKADADADTNEKNESAPGLRRRGYVG